jgi:hypothetical protein
MRAMNTNATYRGIRSAALLLAVAALAAFPAFAAADGPPEVPADLQVAVSADGVAPGETVDVDVVVVPKPGIKINRYPNVTVQVPEVDGLVAAAQGKAGSSKPPTPEDMEAGRNYFKTVDPVRVTLAIDAGADAGAHRVEADVKYFYCVTSSGFCAPKKTKVTIPLQVR